MDESTYIFYVSCHFMCDKKLAEKLVRSAEINGTKRELDKIVESKEKELGQNASKYV